VSIQSQRRRSRTLPCEMLSNQLVRGRSSINATNRAEHHVAHKPVNGLHIKGVFLPASALNFYWHHESGVVAIDSLRLMDTWFVTHSCRRATIGSTRAARRPGNQQAIIATASSRRPLAANVNGSLGLTANSKA